MLRSMQATHVCPQIWQQPYQPTWQQPYYYQLPQIWCNGAAVYAGDIPPETMTIYQSTAGAAGCAGGMVQTFMVNG